MWANYGPMETAKLELPSLCTNTEGCLTINSLKSFRFWSAKAELVCQTTLPCSRKKLSASPNVKAADRQHTHEGYGRIADSLDAQLGRGVCNVRLCVTKTVVGNLSTECAMYNVHSCKGGSHEEYGRIADSPGTPGRNSLSMLNLCHKKTGAYKWWETFPLSEAFLKE